MFKVATYVGQNLKISDSFHSFCEALMVEIGGKIRIKDSQMVRIYLQET